MDRGKEKGTNPEDSFADTNQGKGKTGGIVSGREKGGGKGGDGKGKPVPHGSELFNVGKKGREAAERDSRKKGKGKNPREGAEKALEPTQER